MGSRVARNIYYYIKTKVLLRADGEKEWTDDSDDDRKSKKRKGGPESQKFGAPAPRGGSSKPKFGAPAPRGGSSKPVSKRR
jgi:hypothetical protein